MRWPDSIKLPNNPELFENLMRIIVKVDECTIAFVNFSDILLQFVEYLASIRQFSPEFVRIPNEIEPKTSDGRLSALFVDIVTLFQYAILSFAKTASASANSSSMICLAGRMFPIIPAISPAMHEPVSISPS